MIHNNNTDKTKFQKPILPNWIMSSSASLCLEEAVFASSSALALLHVTMSDLNIGVPTKLLRQRLALKAAANCLKIEGRIEEDVAIRDAYLLTQTNKGSVAKFNTVLILLSICHMFAKKSTGRIHQI